MIEYFASSMRMGVAIVAAGLHTNNTSAVAPSAAGVQRDPAGTLPHYPLWDMNRGFGP